MTDRQDYLNRLIDYKTYYSRVAHHYNYEELEQLVSEWLGTKFSSVTKELRQSLKNDSLLNNIQGWTELVPRLNTQKMSSAFAKAGGVMARGEVVCVLKEVARGIAK